MWTEARQPTGEPAKWIAVCTPYIEAKSADALRLADGTRGQRVRMDDVDGAVVDEVAEAFLQTEEALAGGDRVSWWLR